MASDKFNFLRGKILSGKIYPKFFPFKVTDRIVNIGCGQGPQAIIYRDQFQEMVGVDIDQERLDLSHEAMKLYQVKNYGQTLIGVFKKI